MWIEIRYQLVVLALIATSLPFSCGHADGATQPCAPPVISDLTASPAPDGTIVLRWRQSAACGIAAETLTGNAVEMSSDVISTWPLTPSARRDTPSLHIGDGRYWLRYDVTITDRAAHSITATSPTIPFKRSSG